MFLEGFGVANRKRLLERTNRSWRPSNFNKEAFCSFCSLHFLHSNDFPAKKRMKPQCPHWFPKLRYINYCPWRSCAKLVTKIQRTRYKINRCWFSTRHLWSSLRPFLLWVTVSWGGGMLVNTKMVDVVCFVRFVLSVCFGVFCLVWFGLAWLGLAWLVCLFVCLFVV